MAFQLAYLRLTLAHSKRQGQGHALLIVNISQTVTDRANINIATSRKSHIAFPMAYSYLTLTHSKGHVQGHAISIANFL